MVRKDDGSFGLCVHSLNDVTRFAMSKKTGKILCYVVEGDRPVTFAAEVSEDSEESISEVELPTDLDELEAPTPDESSDS